jgi:hypothetical protein
MKIRPVGDELFYADRQTDRQDMTKVTVAFFCFCNFANASRNVLRHLILCQQKPAKQGCGQYNKPN